MKKVVSALRSETLARIEKLKQICLDLFGDDEEITEDEYDRRVELYTRGEWARKATPKEQVTLTKADLIERAKRLMAEAGIVNPKQISGSLAAIAEVYGDEVELGIDEANRRLDAIALARRFKGAS